MRKWRYVTDCCRPRGTIADHPEEEAFIICAHGVPLKPLTGLDSGFLERFYRERRQFLDRYRATPDSFTFGRHGEVPPKAGLLEPVS